METGWLPAADGTRLFYRWAGVDEPKALLVFVHGFGEHTGRYAHVFEAMNARGYACFAFDYRGHGRAEGRRAYVERYADYVSDTERARALAREKAPDAPLYMVGHSQGGLIVLTWLLAGAGVCDGLVLSSPALGVAVPVPAWKEVMGRVMSRIYPTLALPTGLEPEMVSRSPEIVEAYATDPLIVRAATARWYTEFVAAQARALAGAPSIVTPALVMQAGVDRVADPDATRRLFERLGSSDKTWSPWPDCYHELFNEPEREQVFDAVDAWLQARL